MAAAVSSGSLSQHQKDGMQRERSDLPRGIPLPCHDVPCVQATAAGSASLLIPPHQQQQQLHPDYSHGSGLARDNRISVPRKDLYDLIGKHPNLPLEVLLRINIQGVAQEGEQRVRLGKVLLPVFGT